MTGFSQKIRAHNKMLDLKKFLNLKILIRKF